MDDGDGDDFDAPPIWKAVLVALVLGIALVCIFAGLK